MNARITGAALALMTTPALGAGPALAAPGCGYGAADADGDARVTRAEAQAFMDAQFARHDADGDGAIAHDEYGACIEARTEAAVDRVLGKASSQGEHGSDRAARGVAFDAVDVDRDGSLNREEWADAAASAYAPDRPKADATADAPAADGGAAGGDRGMSASAGSQAEASAGARGDDQGSIGGPGVRFGDESPAGNRFGEENPNYPNDDDSASAGAQDTRSRRVVIFAPLPDGERAGRRAALSFLAHDRDRDGRVSRAEFDQGPAEITGPGFAAGFRTLDRNDDGRVSVQEYRAAQDAAWQEASGGEPDRAVPVILYRLHVR